jgi:ribosomal protein S18 acetylase RimI-like enzyme
MRLRLGALQRGHRDRLREILDASDAFREDEVDVALELFDEVFAGAGNGNDNRGSVPFDAGDGAASYEFVGLFTRDERGELAGYACYGATPGTDRTYDLYWLAVHPSYQGAGNGTLLLEEVERRLRQREARLLVVETSSRNDYDATRRFYEMRGYIEAARVSDFYSPSDHRVILTKRITEVAAPHLHLLERGVASK